MYFLLAILFATNAMLAQKITINPDLVVGNSDFTVTSDKTESNKANLHFETIHKDTLTCFIVVRGFCIWGLQLDFYKNSIKPKYYFWDDDGGHTTVLDFDWYELKLNASSYKAGDTMIGRFKGVASEQAKDGKIYKHKLSGKFVYTVDPDKAKRELKERQNNPGTKIYRTTNFYYVTDADKGLKAGAPTYELTAADEEYYISKEPLLGLNLFDKVAAVSDKTNPAITNFIFSIDNKYTDLFKDLSRNPRTVAFVVDNVLWQVQKSITIVKGTFTLPIAIKGKENINALVQKINSAIQKNKKPRKSISAG